MKKEIPTENKETDEKPKTPIVVNGKAKKEKGLTKLKDKLLGKRKKDSALSAEPSKKAKQADLGSTKSSVETPLVRSNVKSAKAAAETLVSSASKKARTSNVSNKMVKDFDEPAFNEGGNSITFTPMRTKNKVNEKQTQMAHQKVGLDTLELKHIHDQGENHKKMVQKNALTEEVEVWVPNKKYSGKLKGAFEKQQQVVEGKKFAQFEHGVHTPPAFIRKSVAKATAPNTDPGKTTKASRSSVCIAVEPFSGTNYLWFNLNVQTNVI